MYTSELIAAESANRPPAYHVQALNPLGHTPHIRTENFNEPRAEASAAAANVITLPGSASSKIMGLVGFTFKP